MSSNCFIRNHKGYPFDKYITSYELFRLVTYLLTQVTAMGFG